MALGIEKGDKVSLLSEGRNMWVIGELGILYAGVSMSLFPSSLRREVTSCSVSDILIPDS